MGREDEAMGGSCYQPAKSERCIIIERGWGVGRVLKRMKKNNDHN